MTLIQPQSVSHSAPVALGAQPFVLGEPIAESRPQVHVNEAVRLFTASLFNGKITIATTFDPEIDNPMQVVTVETRGTVDELANKSDLWHRHLHEAAGDLTCSYALSIIPLDDCD